MAPGAGTQGVAKAKPRAALNPSFTWDGGADVPAPAVQAAWDFKGAAAEVEREHRATRTTPVEAKIAAALRAKGMKKPPSAAKGVPPPSGKKRGAAAAAAAAASDDDAEVSDEDDDVLDAELESSDDDAVEPAWNAAGDDEDDDDVLDDDASGSGSSDAEEEAEDPFADARAGKLAARAVAALERSGAKRGADGGAKPPAAADDGAPELEDAFAARPRAARAAAGAEDDAPRGDTWGQASERAGRRPSAAAASNPSKKGPAKGDASFSADSFAELGLSKPLLKAISALGYTQPTPIQAAVVPLGLTGRDICGRAVTGSGKTAAFMLPLLERLLHRSRSAPGTRVLVVTPTRELAVQIREMGARLAQFTDIRIALVVGGLSLGVQASELRQRPEVVVATPGRLIDHLRNTQSFTLEDLAALVLDEADRLLELGFADEIAELLRLCPVRRQTLLFSATLTPAVEQLAALSLQQPARLSADGMGAAPATLTQEIVRVRPSAAGDKEAIVMTLLSRAFAGQRVIVFARTKARAHRLKVIAGLVGLDAAELHGDMTQAQRLASLETFRTGEAQLLIATDVAARGLDIAAVSAVVSLDAPRDVAAYLHRCGRTARAGAAGTAVTLAEEKDRPLLKALAAASKGAGGGGGALRERRVDPAAIAAWRERLEGLADALEHVTELEKEEAMHRRADMEAAKAEHLLEHAEDIASRPARSWFQSEHEKLRAAKVARAAATKPAAAAAKAAKAGKKRGAEAGAEDDAKPGKKGRGARDGDADGDGEGDGGDEPPAKPRARDDPLAIARRGAALAKGAAKRALAAGLRPSAAKEAGRQALRKDAKLARRRLLKEGGAAAKADGGGGPGGLFAGDGINGARPGRDAPRSSSGAARIDMKAAGAPRPLRDGGARKKSGFKSKKRYKRR